MRPSPRSLAVMMVGIAGVGLSLAAVRLGDPFLASTLTLATLALLTSAVLFAVYRRGLSRAFWLGFTLFGWGYGRLALAPLADAETRSLQPAAILLDRLLNGSAPLPSQRLVPPAGPEEYVRAAVKLHDSGRFELASRYLKAASTYRDLLNGAERRTLDDYLDRMATSHSELAPPPGESPTPWWLPWTGNRRCLEEVAACWLTMLAGCLGGWIARAARRGASTEKGRPAMISEGVPTRSLP